MSISVPIMLNATAILPDVPQGKKGDKGDAVSLSVSRYVAPAILGSNLEAFALIVPSSVTIYQLTTDTNVKFISVINRGSAMATAGTFSVAPGDSICLIRDPSNNSWISI